MFAGVRRSMDSLLLLARRFPFNHGEVAAESYLETEIGYLANSFDRILVVATEASVGDTLTCELPDNVEAIALGCIPTREHKIGLVARGVLYPAFAPAVVREAVATDPVRSVRRRAFRGYFAARAFEKFDRLVTELERRSFEPTALYSFWLYDTALTAFWVRKVYPCARAIARAHGYDLYQDRTHVGYLPFRKLLLSGLDAVVPCSEDGRAYIDVNWPGHTDRLFTSYLGTADLPDLSNCLREGDFHVVSCSRVVSIKRVGLIANALALLDADGRSIRWTHYGDGPALSDVKNRCVKFSSVTAEFPGSVSNKDLLRIYCRDRIDLFVNASESEGLPISIMEACGVGSPVLATDVGGVREIVRDTENGFLLKPDLTPRELADAIVRVMDASDDEMMRMRRSSRQIWSEKFRAKNNVEQLTRMLCLKGGNGA